MVDSLRYKARLQVIAREKLEKQVKISVKRKPNT